VLDIAQNGTTSLPNRLTYHDDDDGWGQYVEATHWWLDMMRTRPRPVQEKMTLFWHGHFTSAWSSIGRTDHMMHQNQMYRENALGNFRDILVNIAQDTAMLFWLDGYTNTRTRPQENFGREIMELFTMGVGNYTEEDIREAARAFTGWNYRGLDFVVNPAQHDADVKKVLGHSGKFDGVQVIDIILAQPVTAEFVATKLYRFFVRDEVTPELRMKLGKLLRDSRYEIAPFLETIFNSRDFYSDEAVATHIKSPVELVVSTYRKMGLKEVPGIPDFNELTDSMGQKLMFPPNVAGWASGKSWITPGLLLVRGNFIYDTVFPQIDFVANDRVPGSQYQIISVAEQLSMGKDVTTATKPDGKELSSMSMQADRDEDFNTRLASYHAWRKAIEKVKPIPRTTAQLDVSGMVRAAGCKTAQDAVDHLLVRFLITPVSSELRKKIGELLAADLGTTDLKVADSYMEDALRNALHVILSLPDYQLG
jgi:hypothetical protein